MVKNPPANAGDLGDVGLIPGLGRSLGGGYSNPLQYLTWRIPWTEEPCGLQFVGLEKIRHNRETDADHISSLKGALSTVIEFMAPVNAVGAYWVSTVYTLCRAGRAVPGRKEIRCLCYHCTFQMLGHCKRQDLRARFQPQLGRLCAQRDLGLNPTLTTCESELGAYPFPL